MSLTCTKDYTLTVSPPSVGRGSIYYTFETSSFPFIDSKNSVNLTSIPPSVPSSDAGKVGNCIKVFPPPDRRPSFLIGNNDPSILSNPLLERMDVCFWLKINSFTHYQPGSRPSFWIFQWADNNSFNSNPTTDGPLYWPFGFQLGIDDGVVFAVRQFDLFGGHSWLPGTFTAVLGTWYFIRVFWDPSDGKVGFQVDDGAISKSPTVTAPHFNGSNYGQICIGAGSNDLSGDIGSFDIDELCANFKGGFTDAQCTWLYNAGAGKTWPLVGFPGGFPP